MQNIKNPKKKKNKHKYRMLKINCYWTLNVKNAKYFEKKSTRQILNGSLF